MAFYSSKKILINSLLSLISMIVVGLAFQNCSNGLSSSSPRSNTVTSDTSGMRVISDPEDTQAPITTDLKIELLATDLLKVDCSLPGSGYKFEISNAGSDILMCQEYTLDMPAGNSRYGESYKCDSSDKFVSPASAWSYDVGQRKWSKTTYTNSDQFTPGDYRLYVRDNLGEVKSSLLKMRHYGYANCVNPNPVIAEQPATGVPPVGGTTTVVTSCSWAGDDFSPATPPVSSCTSTRANQKEINKNGIEYTCLCSNTTVVQTPVQQPPSSTQPGGVVTPQPTTGACNPAGTILTRVTTELPNKVFPRTNYYPEPHQIHSFAFKTTSASSTVSSGMLSVAVLSSSNTGKLVVISTCAGDIDTAGKDAGCSRFGAETSTVPYVVNNVTPVKPNIYCNLKPNTQYYFNVVPRETTNGARNCTAKEKCGFSFLGN